MLLITHNGIFHGDEVMATAILLTMYPGAEVRRVYTVSEEDIANESNIIYDIGYGELDHHQPGGNGVHEDGTPYAACGLVWRRYGMELCKQFHSNNPGMVFDTIERELIIGIDAHDNGSREGTECTVSAVIKSFNPSWKEDPSTADTAFMTAVEFATTVFKQILKKAVDKADAVSVVAEAEAKAENGLLIMDRFVPWQQVITRDDLRFVVFPSLRGGYNIQQVPGNPAFPEAWRGLTGSSLVEASGVSGSTFCHQAGFIASATTLDAAIQLAMAAM